MFSVSTETSFFLNLPGAGGAFEAHVALTRRDEDLSPVNETMPRLFSVVTEDRTRGVPVRQENKRPGIWKGLRIFSRCVRTYVWMRDPASGQGSLARVQPGNDPISALEEEGTGHPGV